MASEYLKKLKHPLWQKRKAEIFQRDNYTCKSCGSKDVTLHAHHLLYLKDAEPWEYPDELLITYCEICHNTDHLIGTVLKEELLNLIKEKPLMIHLIAQACILTEKYPKFSDYLREFLREQMNLYYEDRKDRN
jgi:hypothetical protein